MAPSIYPLPRGADGKIVLFDEPPAAEPPPPTPPPALGAGAPAPQRRRGETPTPIDQLRPGQVGAAPAPTPAAERWRMALATVATIAILGLAGWALWVSGPPAANSAAATPAPTADGQAPPVAPTPAPSPTATPAAELDRAIVVYDVPDGTPVGALEPGRSYTLVEEEGGWRQLEVAGSGQVWARAWEMDGLAPPEPTPTPEPPPPTAAPRPAPRPAPAPVVPVGPPVTCQPVVDADNGNRYLGDACGTTSAERQARALELLQAAPPPTLSGGQP